MVHVALGVLPCRIPRRSVCGSLPLQARVARGAGSAGGRLVRHLAARRRHWRLVGHNRVDAEGAPPRDEVRTDAVAHAEQVRRHALHELLSFVDAGVVTPRLAKRLARLAEEAAVGDHHLDIRLASRW